MLDSTPIKSYNVLVGRIKAYLKQEPNQMLNLVKLTAGRDTNPNPKRGPKGEGRQAKIFVTLRNMKVVGDQDIQMVREAVREQVLDAMHIKNGRDDIKMVWYRNLGNHTPGFGVFKKVNKEWTIYRHNRADNGAFTNDTRDFIVDTVVELKDAVQQEGAFC